MTFLLRAAVLLSMVIASMQAVHASNMASSVTVPHSVIPVVVNWALRFALAPALARRTPPTS